MSRFRKVDAGTWGDARFQNLSEDGKLLWLYLLTGPEVTSLPGLIVAGRAHLAEVFGWDVKRFDRSFAELAAPDEDGLPMARADWKARVIWLPKAWKYNRPANPSVLRGWRDHLKVIPECDLKKDAVRVLREFVETLGASYLVVSATVFDTVSTLSGTQSLVRARTAPAPASAPAPAPALWEGVQGEPPPEPSVPVAPPTPRGRSGTLFAEPEAAASPAEPAVDLAAAKLTREQQYAAAYAAGIARGKGSPYVFPTGFVAQGDLNSALPAFAKGPDDKPLRGDAVLAWITANAEAFAEYASGEDPKYWSSYNPKGFLRWLNERGASGADGVDEDYDDPIIAAERAAYVAAHSAGAR